MHTGACIALYMQSNMWCNRTGVIIHGGPCSHGGPCIYIYGYTMNLDISISLSICVCVYLCTHIYCIFKYLHPAMISCHWQSLFKTADVFDEACLLSAASQGKTLSSFFFLLKWFHPHAASATFFFLGSPQFTDSFAGSLVLAKAARGRRLPVCCYTRIDSYSRAPPESIYNIRPQLQEVNGTLVNHDFVPKCYIKAGAARPWDPALRRLHQRVEHTGTHGCN